MARYSALRSSAAVTGLTVVCSLLSFLNQLIIANVFGASVQMDAYLIAISIPVLVSGIVGGIFSYSMVPTLIFQKTNASSYRQFAGLMLISTIVLGLAVTAAGFFISPVILRLLAKSLPDQLQFNAVDMAKTAWVCAGFMIVTSYLTALLNASKRFLIPVIVTMFPYIAMSSFVAAAGNRLGAISIVLGMAAGYAMGVVLLFLYSRTDMELSWNCFGLWKESLSFFGKAPLILIAMLIFTVHQFIDAYWAPQTGEASLSYLGYCQRLLIALGGLVIVGPSAVLVPRITEAVADGRIGDFYNDCGRSIRTVLAFGTGITVVVSVLAAPVVELLFQRGAFDAAATRGVASILPIMMIGMSGMLGVVILFRALFAKRNVAISAFLGLIAAISYFVLSGILSRFFSLAGIALAYAISWWAVLIAGLFMFYRRNRSLLLSRENVLFFRHLLATLAVVGVTALSAKTLLIRPAGSGGFGILLLNVGVVAVLAFGAFYVMSVMLLRMADVSSIFEFARESMFGIVRTDRTGK